MLSTHGYVRWATAVVHVVVSTCIVNVIFESSVTSPTSVVTDACSLVRVQCAWFGGNGPSAICGQGPGAGPMSGAAWTGLVLTTTAAVTNNASTKTIDPTRRITSPSLSRADHPTR